MDNMIYKAAHVDRLVVDEKELSQINQHTVREFAADEIFTFKVALCNNQVDRDYEQFSDEALEGLAELFKGKTVISDHSQKASNQCARIYDAFVEVDNSVKRLMAKCYMVRCDSTKDLITEIEAGIKKEVSVSCAIQEIKCSVCGADNRKVLCEHIGGRIYNGKACHFVLNNPTDAYEVSFVAVPAQKQAGVVKDYGGKPGKTEEPEKSFVSQRIRATESFIFINKQEE